MSYGGGGVPVGATQAEVLSALVASLAVPSADSAANVLERDVVGTKLDTVDGDSLYAQAKLAASQVAAPRSCYPTLAAGATVVSANTNWGLGAFATVVPASAIAADYRITSVSVEACNRDAAFELHLFQGSSDVSISNTRFTVEGGFFGNLVKEVGSGIIPANAQVRARLASSNGAAQIATIVISIDYWPF